MLIAKCLDHRVRISKQSSALFKIINLAVLKLVLQVSACIYILSKAQKLNVTLCKRKNYSLDFYSCSIGNLV